MTEGRSTDAESGAPGSSDAAGDAAGAERGETPRPDSRLPIVGVFLLFTATILGALALAPSFREAGLRTFEDTGDVSNSALIVGEILVVTVIFLAAIRFGVGKRVLRAVLILVFGFSASLAVGAVLGPAIAAGWTVATLFGLGVAVVLWVHPEWYVIDAVAVVAGAAITAQLGISLGPLPAVVLLVAMAVYDAYSVYVSGHMVELAGGVGELKVPMVFVVPASASFSLREVDDIVDADVDASMLGLGDAFFPGMLAVSAGTFLDAPALLPGTALNLPALGAVVGGVLGMVGLQYLAREVEGAHAGLPMLNGGVLAGYLLGALAAGVAPLVALGLA